MVTDCKTQVCNVRLEDRMSDSADLTVTCLENLPLNYEQALQRLTFHYQPTFIPIFSDGLSNQWYLCAIPGALTDQAEWRSALKNFQSGDTC